MSFQYTENEQLSKNQKRDNKRIPLYFVLAFLLVFAVNGVFVYTAVSSHLGVTTEDAYEKGLDYDNIVSQVRELKAKQQSHGTDTQ